MADNALTAVADSIALQREIEGLGGGPATREQLQRAVDYYRLDYARYTPATLAAEIHRCRAMVVDMLARDQPETDRRELHGWADGSPRCSATWPSPSRTTPARAFTWVPARGWGSRSARSG